MTAKTVLRVEILYIISITLKVLRVETLIAEPASVKQPQHLVSMSKKKRKN